MLEVKDFLSVFLKLLNLFHRKNLFQKVIFRGSLFVIALIFSGALSGSGDSEKINICLFELDNTKTSDNLEEKQRQHNGANIHRYTIRHGEKGRQAFERMIRDGKPCDSLVMSGHHTGDWFGKTGTVWLKDMEALSCRKEYKAWFEKIKALWLDGCNTVTDGLVSASKKPDFSTVHFLGKKTDKTKLNKRYMTAYQQSYTNSLDKHTPLSSRYLRMFPKTQIYGFNGSAPTGEQKRNQSFIFSHLTALGKGLRDDPETVKTDFQLGLDALSNDPCDPKARSAWETVARGQASAKAIANKDYKQAHKWGCDLILAKKALDNPNFPENQRALAQQILNDPQYRTNDEILALANSILKGNTTQELSEATIRLAKTAIIQTLKAVNKADKDAKPEDKPYSQLLFNNIYETWSTAKKYKTRDSLFFNQVKNEFKEESFTKSLKARIKEPTTASLRKGDYIKFYAEIHDVNIRRNNSKALFVKNQTKKLFERAKNIFSDSLTGGDLDLSTKRILAVSVADQLLQYDLLNSSQIRELAGNKKLFPDNTRNPFIADTQLRFLFKSQPNTVSRIVDRTIRNYDKSSTPANNDRKQRAIRLGVGVYLDSFSKGDFDSNRKKMNSLARRTVDEDSYYSFFRALYDHLNGHSPDKQVQVLLDLSRNTGEDLEKLVIDYANSNLADDSARKIMCEKIEEEMLDDDKHKRKGYILNGCP